jgi:hypothetical protein
MPLLKLESSTQAKAESLINFSKLEKKEVVQSRVREFFHRSISHIKHG